MSFFDKILEQLFPKRLPEHLPVIEEALVRSPAYRNQILLWQNSGAHRKLAYQVWEAWQLKKQKQVAELEVHILKTQGSNGIALTYHPQIGKQEFQFFFDHLKEQTLQIGYRLYTSDRRIFARSNYSETIEKHYLKPPIDLRIENGAVQPCDQRYGNVIIEHIQIDDKPSFIRLMAHYYQDQLYRKALPFEELLQQILL
ncbi:MAG: hypothetical protein RMJ87_04050 [Cytophagales bacterium]|nr:hypothetical protein [Bernardetiaceae bacterium]MDW8204181.1 hypothetical protein [Cytophagales bacterium]